MKKNLAVLMAVTVVLAGCMGGFAGSSGTPEADNADNLGKVNLYISDQPNDIGDFKHLNVTITKVGFKKVNNTTANATGESDTWVTYDVEGKTVDLTTLQGANATLLSEFNLPNGTYEKVFIYVSEIDATLKNNESARVKLPSQKLHINEKFTVDNNESLDFVFDISVHKAGKSGKYILKPVVSESGVDVPMKVVDNDDEREGEIQVSVEGNVSAGEEVTVRATQNGSAVANATVKVNGEVVGKTDSDGEITVTVPSEDEFEVEVESEESEGEVEIGLGDEEGDEDDESDEEREREENESNGENETNREDEKGESSDNDEREDELGGNINIEVSGQVVAGEEVTLKATHDGSAVANATVKVNGEVVGKTDSDGEITVTVPTTGVLEVEIEKGDAEGEVEIEI
ncbi:MAG: DUF4382 domain-containing protein [Halobacteria archaeon]|nr:DUF4382 domain-containing protein [Halobacteria archaeon]